MISSHISLWLTCILLAAILTYKLFKPRIKGAIGEKAVALRLSRLPKSKYKVINNLVLEMNNWTSQIDHLIISDYGIFVVETKNLKGWIFGNENSEHWTQVIFKRREVFYNPIRQNQSHIRALRHHLQEYPHLEFIPIVAFSNSCTLKVKTYAEVVYSSYLIETIKGYDEPSVSEPDKSRIYDKLNALNMSAVYSRKKHIESIRRRMNKRDEAIAQDKCPRCKGQLVSRQGKYGWFKGCSNYPACRFILND